MFRSAQSRLRRALQCVVKQWNAAQCGAVRAFGNAQLFWWNMCILCCLGKLPVWQVFGGAIHSSLLQEASNFKHKHDLVSHFQLIWWNMCIPHENASQTHTHTNTLTLRTLTHTLHTHMHMRAHAHTAHSDNQTVTTDTHTHTHAHTPTPTHTRTLSLSLSLSHTRRLV